MKNTEEIIPTAKELLDNWQKELSVHFRNMANDLEYREANKDRSAKIGEGLEERIVEFAKLHVELALKVASEKANLIHSYHHVLGEEYSIDKQSILDSYPLSKII